MLVGGAWRVKGGEVFWKQALSVVGVPWRVKFMGQTIYWFGLGPASVLLLLKSALKSKPHFVMITPMTPLHFN
jgi:hypothetical protein